jgi:signal transduction histidine kinase
MTTKAMTQKAMPQATMTQEQPPLTHRERELGAIINAYNEVTDRLKHSHDSLVGEVRRLREQLEEKNRELARRERLAALGEMAAGVAHEIRNPLAGIQLYASLLYKDLGDRAEARELARKISGGVQTLDGIVGDVLAFAGHAHPQVHRVNLGAVVRDCLAYAAPVQSSRATAIHADNSIDGFDLLADYGQVQRALLNLIFNAIDAAGEEGDVWISADRDVVESFCRVTVADNGPGIADDLVDKIFNPFFTTKDSGTGLGLAIVHRIAEAHGGRIQAARRAEGGTRMTLALPLCVDTA